MESHASCIVVGCDLYPAGAFVTIVDAVAEYIAHVAFVQHCDIPAFSHEFDVFGIACH